jgi:oligopeptide/dipeptide ABC transporter ATP-binding protein
VEYPDDTGDGWRAVVDGLSLEIGAGETVGLVGESGSGKSVAALACLGLVREPGRISSGRIAVAGVELASASESEIARVRGGVAGMIFQEPSTALNPVLSVGSQLVETVRSHRSIHRTEALSEARRLLRETALDDTDGVLAAYPHQLSGGQLQRVMIAMALAGGPRLLIADEPTTALDLITQARILGLLERLTAEQGLGLLLISHDLSVVAGAVDRVVVVYAGRVVEEGPADELFATPLHPYTRLLVESIPGRAGEREPARGSFSAVLPRVGCRFASRCRLVEPTCRDSEPDLVPLDTLRSSRCPVTLREGEGRGDV